MMVLFVFFSLVLVAVSVPSSTHPVDAGTPGMGSI
jgi:hypothetical protein